MPKRIRTGTVISVGLVIALLGALTFHLWNFDYSKKEIDTTGATNGVIMARMGVDQYGKRVVINFSIFNAGNAQLCLADTASLNPLYDIQLLYQGDDKTPFEIVGMSNKYMAEISRRHMEGQIQFNPEMDAVVRLVPGAGLTRNIELNEIFDFVKPGKYKVIAKYRPSALKETMGAAFDSLGAYAREIECSTEFDFLVKKPEVPKSDSIKAAVPAPEAPKVEPAKAPAPTQEPAAPQK